MCTNMKSMENLEGYRVFVLIHYISDIPFSLKFENDYFVEYEFLN